jgi:hypothetical protein
MSHGRTDTKAFIVTGFLVPRFASSPIHLWRRAFCGVHFSAFRQRSVIVAEEE